jgi:16S rRNA (cytidine1402-2'-O)-methyltransferase
MSILYLVATPIGNLEDMTFRAVRVLREVSLIAAEDTRHTGRLLQHYDIDTPQISYHDYSSAQRLQQLLDRLALGNVAVVSDAGTPGVSDPGFRLVQAALEAGHEVTSVPGANAAIAALVASGLPTDQFLFGGFLPRQEQARRQALQNLAFFTGTLLFYESPRRLLGTLATITAVWGDRQVCIARELTKLHEEWWRGSASEAHTYFANQEKIRGEITLVVAGADTATHSWGETEVTAVLKASIADGQSIKDAVSEATRLSGWRKKQVYRLALQIADS